MALPEGVFLSCVLSDLTMRRCQICLPTLSIASILNDYTVSITPTFNIFYIAVKMRCCVSENRHLLIFVISAVIRSPTRDCLSEHEFRSLNIPRII
jgi:hypothetical protein